MQMTDGEIITSYRQAKNKTQQVGILAELNACSKEEIKKILTEGGIRQQELPRQRKQKEEKGKPAVINKEFEEAVKDMVSSVKKEPEQQPKNAAKTKTEEDQPVEAVEKRNLPDPVKEAITKQMIEEQEAIDRHTERLRELNEYLTGIR